MGQYLSGPCTIVEIEEGSGDGLEFGVGSMQGWRVAMEDAHIAVIGLKHSDELNIQNSALFCVFDGHGGKDVAMFAKAFFEDTLISSSLFKEKKYGEALRSTFHKIDELLEDIKYDDLLKNFKKIVNPSSYISEPPSSPIDKLQRNIKFSRKTVRRLGANEDPLGLQQNMKVDTPGIDIEQAKLNVANSSSSSSPKPSVNGTYSSSVTSASSGNTVENGFQKSDKSLTSRNMSVTAESRAVEAIASMTINMSTSESPSQSPTAKLSPSSNKGSLPQEGSVDANDIVPIFMPDGDKVDMSSQNTAQLPEIVPPTVCNLSNHRVTSGCTAVAVLKINDTLYVANAGDSRAVLCRGDGSALALSYDHKPSDEKEYNRVVAAGGFVNQLGRINGNLNLSRSLGDLKYKQSKHLPPESQIITAEPDIMVCKMSPDDKFLILGCDGIWDCLTSQQACDIVEQLLSNGLAPGEVIPAVLEGILARDTVVSKGIGTDNMTLIIVRFVHDHKT